MIFELKLSNSYLHKICKTLELLTWVWQGQSHFSHFWHLANVGESGESSQNNLANVGESGESRIFLKNAILASVSTRQKCIIGKYFCLVQRYFTQKQDLKSKYKIILLQVDGTHMYQLSSPNASWTTMKQTLKVGRYSHVSFLIPDAIVTCHWINNTMD